MVKKSSFNGLVRIEFENAKTTEVACLTMNDCIVEIRHDAEYPSKRYQELESDTLQVRAGERLVLVMTEDYAKYGKIQPSECDAVYNLYHVARRFKHDRLRVKIYAKTEEGDKGECVGYAWIGKGKGVAEGDTNTESAENEKYCDNFGFICFTLFAPKGYSTESKNEPLTAHVSVTGADYEIDAVIKFLNPQTDAQTIIIKSDALNRKLSDIINYWEN